MHNIGTPPEIITRKNVDISSTRVACKCDQSKLLHMQCKLACYTSTTLVYYTITITTRGLAIAEISSVGARYPAQGQTDRWR